MTNYNLTMATMKSYTDINQSRKLAEILSIESADFQSKTIESNADVDVDDVSYVIYPCWSLAALLNIIPQELFDGEYIINITEGVNHKWIISYEHYSEVSSYIDVSSDSLIDCCVEIIIKLKEINML
jgi:hypothetical protein